MIECVHETQTVSLLIPRYFIFFSALVLNLSWSEFLMVTSFFPGSLIIDVYSFDLITDDPGASTS